LPTPSDYLFDLLPSGHTGITFDNALTFTEEYNPYTFKNFFNGGGVGLGDFNNDNLIDIYLTGNLVDNKLYLNQGNFQFKDITQSAGVACPDVWSSGVSLVDINADGFLDIYVCKSGKPDPEGNRKNELFINQGDLTFTEEAAAYGLDFAGLAVHAVFFDYDLDGDLDCYLLNNSIRSVGGYDIIRDQRNIPSPEGGNMLLKCMRVESGGQEKTYKDVTQAAGIYSSSIGFGLGVSVSDLNNDGWPDIFVSNDFFEKDYLYLNNQDGTFRETVDQSMQELSMGSMGADIADINNDGRQDIFVTEMLPSTIQRIKSKAVFETVEKSMLTHQKGYHRQYGRNVLHACVGFDGPTPIYSELSRYAGVQATEWSWGALIEDFDQDGLKDIFVANGIYKDLLDQDYLNFFNPDQIRKMIRAGEENAITKMFETMPSSPYPNVFFKNKGNFSFADISAEAGFAEPSFSNGSAYADLDNDGDLDIVTNNIAQTASVYRNNSNKSSISLQLKGDYHNTQAIGSKVTAYIGETNWTKELYPMKGFESTVDARVVIPFAGEYVDSLHILWPDLRITKLTKSAIKHDSLLILVQSGSTINHGNPTKEKSKPLLTQVSGLINNTSIENPFLDNGVHRTQSFFISNEGPKLEIADLNGDRKADLIVGSSKGENTKIYLQRDTELVESTMLSPNEQSGEDTDFIVADFNGDRRNDLFIASGGIEFSQASSGIKDRLYLNKNGKLQESENQKINTGYSNTSATIQIDFDGDGDLDILTAERLKPKAYGIPGDVIFYKNENNTFIRQLPTGILKSVGLITDMAKADLNGDQKDEIILACEYDHLKVWTYQDGSWNDVSSLWNLDRYHGKWNRISISDIDNDGDLDIIAANLGENHLIPALTDNQAVLYVNDFDRNGSVETILCTRSEAGDLPLVLRDDLLMQLPALKKKVLNYASYANATMQDLFDQDILSQSILYTLNEFRSAIFINQGNLFEFMALPIEAQWTDQRAILVRDLNGDKRKDIILGGNQYKAKPELGINAASYGQIFLQTPEKTFSYLDFEKSGLFEMGEIRDFGIITIEGKEYLIIAKNNSAIATYLLPEKN